MHNDAAKDTSSKFLDLEAGASANGWQSALREEGSHSVRFTLGYIGFHFCFPFEMAGRSSLDYPRYRDHLLCHLLGVSNRSRAHVRWQLSFPSPPPCKWDERVFLEPDCLFEWRRTIALWIGCSGSWRLAIERLLRVDCVGSNPNARRLPIGSALRMFEALPIVAGLCRLGPRRLDWQRALRS